MRALRYHGPHSFYLDDIPIPPFLPHQVLIAPLFCGLCGSDLHAYLSARTMPFQHTPHPLTGETWPVVLGHEFSGKVVAVGADVRDFKDGDRVAVQPTLCCWTCAECQAGRTNLCEKMGFVGLMGGGGGLSEYVGVDARFVFRLGERVSDEAGALIEPLAVAWHALSHVQPLIQPTSTMLVLGAGPVGLAVIACLKAQQIHHIIAVETAPKRRALASKFGATRVIDPLQEDVAKVCAGQRPDVAFECAGKTASLNAAARAVRSRGTVVVVAVFEERPEVEMMGLLVGEKRMVSSLSYTSDDFRGVIRALDTGRLDVEGMITRKISLDRVEEDGILALLNEKEEHVKILVDVRAKC